MSGLPLLDDAILVALRTRSPSWTYVIANVLCMHFGFARDLRTAAVRRGLRRLERAGLVEQVASQSAVHFSWSLTPAGRDAAARVAASPGFTEEPA